MKNNSVAIISGSNSDKKIVDDTISILNEFKVNYEVKVISAHRNLIGLQSYLKKSEADVFIAIAGMAAHLPGSIASQTTKPVIGVPVSSKLGGLDALLSIVQMPSGIPVACIAIDSGKNAAFLAIEILALQDHKLQNSLILYRKKLSE
jgi:5-(carboxyamino)imidazole ribonucleotide mutase